MQLSRDGMSFSPSVGMGLELYYTSSFEENSVYSSNAKGGENSANTPITEYSLENETEAWNYMQTNTKKNKTEYGALITNKKILVRQLPEDGGDLYVGLRIERTLGKEYIVYNKSRMKLIATLHTHHGLSVSMNNFSYINTGEGSDVFTAHIHQGVIYYLMTEGERFHSMVVINNKRYEDIITNVKSTKPLLNGHVKLIPLTLNIYNSIH